VATWPARAAAGWISRGESETFGPARAPFPWASVTKVVTAVAIWVAVEEGTAGWDDPAGPAGSTLAHLLAHAAGLEPDGDKVLSPPGTRRIYSNSGIERAAAHVSQRAGIDFCTYAVEAVLEPLGMRSTVLTGSPASGARGPLDDLLRLGSELLNPTLVSSETLRHTSAVAFPGLRGVLPGFGRQADNTWGLGVEVRDHKAPHWTGSRNSPRTFGHFGQSGSFLWVDPDLGIALASLADRPFGPWAARAWPALSDQVIEASAR
jgi:CubicO group peptidase (beta-lactamase class C family)